MTATNHAVTGALIGLIVGQPLLAIPLAILSHFICDALPHYASNLPDEVILRSKKFRNYLIVEAALCFVLVVCLASFRPQHWVLAAVCAFAAASPDLLSMNRYLTTRRGQPWQPGRYVAFANGIQWFARPIGAVVEVVWLVSGLVLLSIFLR